VTVILQTNEAPTPSKSKIFAKPAHLFPEPQGHLIATVAMDVYVERLPDKMERLLRTGAASRHDFSLFRSRT